MIYDYGPTSALDLRCTLRALTFVAQIISTRRELREKQIRRLRN